MINNNKPETNLGLIGAGSWGRNYIKTINQISNINLVKIYSKNPQISDIAPTNCEIYRNLDDFLKSNNIDGVIVSSPPKTHAEIAIKLLNKKIPIIIEKPLSTSFDDALKILYAAKKNSGIVFVDHIFLYHPVFRYMKEYISLKGSIISIKSKGGGLGPFRKDISGLWDWAPHDIAMCLDIIGSMPTKISAERIKSANNQNNLAELIKINLIFEKEITVEILTGNNFQKKTRNFSIIRGNEKISFCPFEEKKLIRNLLDSNNINDLKYIEKEYFKNLPLKILIQEFCDSIHKKVLNIKDLILGANVIKILEEINDIL